MPTERTRPKIAAVYRLFDSNDRLLYIGVGADPGARLNAHAREKNWWPQVDLSKTTVAWFPDYREAEVAERHAIGTEGPVHNKRHSPTWLHPSQVRSAQRAAERVEAEEMSVGLARANMTEVISAVRLLRRCVFLTNRKGPTAAIVPIEVGRLVRRVGGADRAAEILADHLGIDVNEVRNEADKD